MSDIVKLRKRYTAEPVPPCRVCGGELSIARAGGGEATKWACSPLEDDPDAPGMLRVKTGRGRADDHYSQSQWTQYRGGDSDVLDLIAEIEKLRAERDDVVEALVEARKAISSLDEGALGYASTAGDVQPWPLRDELLAHIEAALKVKP